MSLDVEEDFDPAILGLAVDTPARPPLTKGDSGHRFSSGRYNSADWVPRVEDQITARIVAQEEISPAHDVVDIVVKEEPIDIKVETVESSEIDLADLMDKPPTRPPTPRHPKARRVIHRMAGSRRFRPGIRLIRRPSLALPIAVKEEETESQARHVPDHLVDVAAAFGIDFVDRLEKETKANATTGAAMPPSVSDLFSALDDLPTAVAICNDIRASMGLPSLNLARSNRIPILRQVAKMREHLYITLAAALLLPNAPDADEIEIVEKGQKPIYLTPTSLDAVGKRLPNAFPRERAAIRSYMPYAYGEEAGKVRWQDGIGKIIGAEGGYRGKWADGDVHVFVDHSNILYGLLTHLYPSSSSSLPPRHLRTLSLPVLSLLLRRGRPTPPGTLHLVASSPLKQDLDPMVRLGFEVSVLKRVEILADEVEDPNAMKLTPKMMTRLPSSEGAVGGLKRYKEQGVDEILHLKILQKLNAREEPGTIVLATGDARGGQFNKDGFVGAVKEALKRGWRVELWSWSDGLSRAWRDVARRERWTEREFSIHLFDEWAEQLVEVLHES